MLPKFPSLRSKLRPANTGRTDAPVPGKPPSSGITGPSARGQGTLPLPSTRTSGPPLAQRTSTAMSLRPRVGILPRRTETLQPSPDSLLPQASATKSALIGPPQRADSLKHKPPPSHASLHAAPAARRPALNATPALFEGEGGRFSIAREKNGQYLLKRDPKPIKNMILSGAGAKGVAYPGALRALSERGMMPGVRNVVGSSAGALMGAMIAAGIDEKELTRFSNEVDFMDLIRKESKEAMAAGAASAKQKSPLAKKLTLVKTIATSLGTKAPMLDEHIDNATRKSTLAGIENSPSRHEPEVDAIHRKLQAGGSVTFQDLRTLNRHLPGTFKEFHCTATLFMEGKKTGQLAVLNADTAPDMPVYEAAHMSAALPTLFLKAKVDGGGFEVGGGNGKTYAIDGGVLMNYPIPELLNGGIENTETTENLTIMAESPQMDTALAGKIADKNNLIGRIGDKFMGVEYKARDDYMHHHAVQQEVVAAPMKGVDASGKKYNLAGNLGLLRFDMSDGVKVDLQDQLYRKTLDHLSGRKQVEKRSDNLNELLFELGDAHFDEMLKGTDERTQPELKADLRRIHTQRQAAGEGLAALAPMSRHWNEVSANRPAQAADLVAWAGRMESSLGHSEDAYAHLAKAMSAPVDHSAKTAVDHAQERMLDVLRDNPRLAESSPLLARCLQEATRKDVQNLAKNITRDFIYPAKNKLAQNRNNMALLNQAQEDLAQAGTRAEVNRALDKVAEAYTLRTFGFSALARKPNPSRTQVGETGRFMVDTLVRPLTGGAHETPELRALAQRLDQARDLPTLEKCLQELKGEMAKTVAARPRSATDIERIDAYLSRLEFTASSSFLREVQTYRLATP